MQPIQIVKLAGQPWYEADDRAVAREVISPRCSRAQAVSIADIRIPPGVVVRRHYHEVIEEIYHVVEGEGVMLLGQAEAPIVAGDTVAIRPGEWHGVRNDTDRDLRLMVTCSPPWTPDCLKFE